MITREHIKKLILNNEWYFIHIPKCGGVSISRMTNFYLRTRHFTYSELVELVGRDALVDKYVFSVVRNPWDRAVSWYFFHRGQNKIREATFNDWVLGGMKTHYPINVFEMYINYLGNGDGCIDYIGKLEDLNDIVTTLNDKGVECTNEICTNVSKRKKDYKVYYSDKTKKIVGEICGDDITRFG